MENKLFFEGAIFGDSNKYYLVAFNSVDIICYDTYYNNIEIWLKRDGSTVKIKCSSEKEFKNQLESFRNYQSINKTKDKLIKL